MCGGEKCRIRCRRLSKATKKFYQQRKILFCSTIALVRSRKLSINRSVHKRRGADNDHHRPSPSPLGPSPGIVIKSNTLRRCEERRRSDEVLFYFVEQRRAHSYRNRTCDFISPRHDSSNGVSKASTNRGKK